MRILLTGPECSGKTHLAEIISKEKNLLMRPEVARIWLKNQPLKGYDHNFLLRINEVQTQIDNLIFSRKYDYVADTGLLVLTVWWGEKYKKDCPFLLNLRTYLHAFNHIFLCSPDIPWVYDALRENPNDRRRLFNVYKNFLSNLSIPYVIIEGQERADKVLSILK